MIIVGSELPLTSHNTAAFGNGSPAVLARLLHFWRTAMAAGHRLAERPAARRAVFGQSARRRREEADA
jgi:hypothetical protein